MAGNSSKETILEQLRHGFAKFELVSSPVPSISSYSPRPNRTVSSHSNYKNNLFFARIGGDGGSPAMKKVERYSVKKVTGDGRCLFRALVKGMAIHKGLSLNSREETENADELRTAVKEVICGKDNERTEYAEALMAITVDESLKRYCQRIGRSDFWGGESELLVSVDSKDTCFASFQKMLICDYCNSVCLGVKECGGNGMEMNECKFFMVKIVKKVNTKENEAFFFQIGGLEL